MTKVIFRKILLIAWTFTLTAIFVYLIVDNIINITSISSELAKLHDPLHGYATLPDKVKLDMIAQYNVSLVKTSIGIALFITLYASFVALVIPKIIFSFKPLCVKNRINPPTL